MTLDSTTIQTRNVRRQATEPGNVREGDIWIDTSGNNNEMNQYTGSTWELIIARGSDNPEYPVEGSLWRDTANGDFNQYDGTTWQALGGVEFLSQNEGPVTKDQATSGTHATITPADPNRLSQIVLRIDITNSGDNGANARTQAVVTYNDATTQTFTVQLPFTNTGGSNFATITEADLDESYGISGIDKIDLNWNNSAANGGDQAEHEWDVTWEE